MADAVEFLNALAPVLAATVGILGGLVAIVKNAPRIRKILGTSDHTHIIVELRELADTRGEMIIELKTQLADERAGRASDVKRLEADLDFARRLANETARQVAREMADKVAAETASRVAAIVAEGRA